MKLLNCSNRDSRFPHSSESLYQKSTAVHKTLTALLSVSAKPAGTISSFWKSLSCTFAKQPYILSKSAPFCRPPYDEKITRGTETRWAPPCSEWDMDEFIRESCDPQQLNTFLLWLEEGPRVKEPYRTLPCIWKHRQKQWLPKSIFP